MVKISKEKWKTWGNVFDEFTLRTLFKLSSQGHFENLESPISIGKESNIFSASTKEGKVIIKIYRLETCDFNKMYDYIRTDPRFDNLRKQRRKIIFAWCQREYRNLLKARLAGVKVPKPIAYLNNVLILEFIGKKEVAPKLKDDIPSDLEKFFNDIVKNMNKLYKAKFVHADLSSFNILNLDEKPVFIDFGQCTPLDDPNVKEFLERDIRNICNFFRKQGLDVSDAEVREKVVGD